MESPRAGLQMFQRGGSFGEGKVKSRIWVTGQRDEVTRQWGQKARE